MCADRVISVALVEDDAGTRARLAQVLNQAPHIGLVYQANTASEMLGWLRGNRVDVLLVDLGLPDRSGLDVVRHCHEHAPATDVMVVTLFGDESHMIRAFEAGARGYLLKDGTEADLARHVVNLHAGGSPMSPLIARQLLERFTAPHNPTAASSESRAIAAQVTEREREVLLTLSRGYTYSEAAVLLGIANSTVQSHVKNIYSKLAVRSRTEAIFEARQIGLL